MGGVVMGVCMALLLLFSAQAMAAAAQAAQVFATGVMPALLPMMILCQVFAPAQNGEHSGRGEYSGAILFAFASGSPAGSQRVRGLWDAGRVAPGALEPLLAAAGVMSPMFFVGTLAAWTGLRTGCWVMLICHWAGALLTAWLVKPRSRGGAAKITREPVSPVQEPARRPRPSLAAKLPGAVTAAAASLMAVCGAMMTFAIIAGVLRALLTALWPAWTAAHEPLLTVFWALLEVGGGSAAVLQAWPAPPLALLCALCSFGGLSIWLQNLLFVSECIRPAKLLWIRMLHGALSMALALLVLRMFPVLTRPF